MSKWIDKSLFNAYVKEKEEQQDKSSQGAGRRMALLWPTPTPGSVTQAEVYEGRLLPDKKGHFTKRYYYHMWRSGDKLYSVFCSKTYNFDAYCPVCSLVNKLYLGTQTDRNTASNMKRKTRHVVNFYVVDDPRDKKIEDEEKKQIGKVKIYEYPDKVDSKITGEIKDKKNGLGEAIFDPGSEGYNLLLKVRSTKPNESGKTFPDYSDSIFSRRPSAIGSDKEIKEIMEKRYDLDEYIKGLVTSDDIIKNILESEMLFSVIRDEWVKYKNGNGKKAEAKPKDDSAVEKDVPDFKPPEAGAAEEDSDAELLAELDKL